MVVSTWLGDQRKKDHTHLCINYILTLWCNINSIILTYNAINSTYWYTFDNFQQATSTRLISGPSWPSCPSLVVHVDRSAAIVSWFSASQYARGRRSTQVVRYNIMHLTESDGMSKYEGPPARHAAIIACCLTEASLTGCQRIRPML